MPPSPDQGPAALPTMVRVLDRPQAPGCGSATRRPLELVAQGHTLCLLSEAEFHAWVDMDPAA